MSQPQETEETSAPQLHSFQTSQTSQVENEGDSVIQVDEAEQDTAENTVEAKEGSEPKVKARSLKATKDLNVIDIAEEAQEEEENQESSGTSVLPLSKIKKIFKTDPEHVSASEAAVFSTAIATELFIQYFTEQASLIARSEKRKKLQYKDFSTAVSNIEQLHFLGDTVPKTVNLKKLVDNNKVNYSSKPLEKGQKTLNFGGSKPSEKKNNDEDDLPDSDPEEIDENDNDEDGVEEAGGNEDDDNDAAEGTGDEENNTEDEGEAPQASVDQDKDVIMTE